MMAAIDQKSKLIHEESFSQETLGAINKLKILIKG
jgi:hypothetical protein